MFFTSPGNRIDLTQRQLNFRKRNVLTCHCFLVWMTIARLQSSIAATFLPCLPRTSARLLQTRASPGLRLKAVKLEVIQTDQNKTINVTFKKGRRVREALSLSSHVYLVSVTEIPSLLRRRIYFSSRRLSPTHEECVTFLLLVTHSS